LGRLFSDTLAIIADEFTGFAKDFAGCTTDTRTNTTLKAGSQVVTLNNFVTLKRVLNALTKGCAPCPAGYFTAKAGSRKTTKNRAANTANCRWCAGATGAAGCCASCEALIF
jgi:hypothetical protein